MLLPINQTRKGASKEVIFESRRCNKCISKMVNCSNSVTCLNVTLGPNISAYLAFIPRIWGKQQEPQVYIIGAPTNYVTRGCKV